MTCFARLDAKGFGLVEIMVAAAIGAIIMLSMSSMMTSVSHSVRGSRTLASRDQLMTKIGREASNSSSLNSSLSFVPGSSGFPGNSGGMFDKCVNGAPPNGCQALDASNNPISYGFTLTDAFGNPVAGPSDANAAVYDVSGAPCPNKSILAPNANCQILVTTTFTPKCSNNQASCAQASSITISYSLYQASGISPPPGMGLLSLKDQTQSVTIGVPFPGTTLGIVNYLAKWSSNTQVGVSQVYEDSTGKIGIGTSSPSALVDIKETRTDTAAGTEAYSLKLTQTISPAVDSSAWFIPLYSVANSGGTNKNLRGIEAIIGQVNWYETSATPQSIYGVEGDIRHHSATTMSYCIGTNGVSHNVGPGTIATAIGVQGLISNYQNSGNISTGYAGFFQVKNDGSTGSITNGYGVVTGNIEATNKWSVYAQDPTAPSFFAGRVGIGTSTPAYQLELSTDSAGKPGTSAWTIASDERLKNIRAPFTRGLDAILGINPIYFKYKTDNPLGLPSDKEYVGIVAQDALKVIPESVTKDKSGFFHVTNDAIIWSILNAVKELYGKIVVHNRQIQKLEQENMAMKAYLCSKDPAAPFCK
jgi:prepilin-type N-terminal cleavage/methylation domain-containing protein